MRRRRAALSALAQRGDKSATQELVKLLESPKEDARKYAVAAFGSDYDVPDAFMDYVGRKGIAGSLDASVVTALLKYVDNESDGRRRAEAVHAIGATRSFLP